MVSIILKFNKDILYEHNKRGTNAIMKATCASKYSDEMMELILSNSPKHYYDASSSHCLLIALRDGYIDAASFLLSKNVNVNVKYSEYYPLFLALDKKYYEIAIKIISLGSKINDKGVHGNTPIIIACRHDNIEIIKLLLTHGANIYDKNNNGISPINYHKFQALFKEWILTSLIFFLQELYIYNLVSFDSIVDIYEYLNLDI